MTDANMAPTPLENLHVFSKVGPTHKDAETKMEMANVLYQEAI